jgi:hypothetical protein
MPDLALAYAVMLRICGVGIVIDALERLTTARNYSDGGLFSWAIVRQRWAHFPSSLRWLGDVVFAGSERLIVVLGLRIGSVAVLFIAPVASLPFSAALTILVATQIFLGLRTAGLGTAGSDLMTLTICGSSWLTTVLVHNSVTMQAGLWFVAAQACLGYTVAGVAKLKAPSWRSGQAIVAVLSTYSYGNQRLHAILSPRPRLCAALCWAMMLWEATFPMVLVVPNRFLFPLLAAGVLFHASLAAVMGLNLFLFTFPATYAAIWAVAR